VTILDISAPLTEELPVFPGDPPVVLEAWPAAPFRITSLCCGSHSGTHVDAPRHLLPDGAGVESLALDSLIGPCRVFDLSGRGGALDAADIRALQLHGVRRALLRTSTVPFWRRRAAGGAVLSPAAAELLAAAGLELLGIDGLSVEAPSGDGEVHRLLLNAGTIILEGLDLSSVAAGDYQLICLPLLLPGGDGAPCRAVLRPLPQSGF
jgi:arylformamidase